MIEPQWRKEAKAAMPDEHGHRWFTFRTDPFRTCAECGICEPKDRSRLKKCRGRVWLELRAHELGKTK